jgi:hypothetical protein
MTLENAIPYIGQIQQIEFLDTVVDPENGGCHKHNCIFILNSGSKIKFQLTADLFKQIREKQPHLIENSPSYKHLDKFVFDVNPKETSTSKKIRKCVIL